MPRHAMVVLAASTVAGAMALGGCQSEEAPSPSPTASQSSASPTTSATTAAPTPSSSPTSEIPAAARKKTNAGAEAFVTYFFDQVNEAWMTPNPDLITQLSDEGCKSCQALSKTASDLKRDGQRYREVPIDINKIAAAKDSPGGQQYVDAELVQNRASVVDAAGKVVLTDPREEFDRTVALNWVGEQWLVFDLG